MAKEKYVEQKSNENNRQPLFGGMLVTVFDEEVVEHYGYEPTGEILEIDGEDVKIGIGTTNDYREYWNVNFRPFKHLITL